MQLKGNLKNTVHSRTPSILRNAEFPFERKTLISSHFTDMDDEDINEEQGKLIRSLPTQDFKAMCFLLLIYLFMHYFYCKHATSSCTDEDCLKVIACVIRK